jgi:hypothetical protein
LGGLSLLRIGLGFIMPVILSGFNFGLKDMVIVSLVILAEILDRIDFYQNLDIITPAKQMYQDYQKKYRASTGKSQRNQRL